jgi:hypothetical protein
MYKPSPPDLDDTDATVHGAIIAEGPISRTRLGQLFRHMSAGRLELITNRLAGHRLIERGLFRPRPGSKGGRPTILYKAAAR